MEEDFCLCPSCGSNVAVVEDTNAFVTSFAHCKYDCGYKWIQLIEPDPETFYSKHPYKKVLNKDKKLSEYDILGHDSEIVPFEGDLEELEDLYYEDKERYNRILKYSDFNNTLLTGNSINLDKDVPNNLISKRKRFFEKQSQELAGTQNDYYFRIIENFLNDNETLDNFIYVICNVCQMELHYNKYTLVENQVFNNIIEPDYEDLKSTPKPSAITYNEYQKTELFNIIKVGNIEEYIQKIKDFLNKKYGIAFLYIKSENDKEEGCRPLETWQKDFLESKDKEENISKKIKETSDIENSSYNIDKDNEKDKKFKEFLSKKTTYNKSIEELFSIIKECSPIAASFNGMKPFIITLEDFYSDIKSNMNIPSLIDYDNNIVFMNISHKCIIEKLHSLNLNVYSNNFFNCIEYIKVEDYLKLLRPTTKKDYEEFIEEQYQGDFGFFQECLGENSKLENFIKMKNMHNEEYLKELENFKGFNRNWNSEEIQQWMDSYKSIKCISYHELSEARNLTDNELEIFFHKETNTVQVFTSLINDESPKMLTFRIENKENNELMKKLKENNIKFQTLTTLSNKSFITLNGKGTISGEIYFPKKDEENIPSGKILVIPTASEEYFLPALSTMEGNGCIITEKGSKTSHLVINSKEFDFNLILVDNATELFKEGDIITIDLDNQYFNSTKDPF